MEHSIVTNSSIRTWTFPGSHYPYKVITDSKLMSPFTSESVLSNCADEHPSPPSLKGKDGVFSRFFCKVKRTRIYTKEFAKEKYAKEPWFYWHNWKKEVTVGMWSLTCKKEPNFWSGVSLTLSHVPAQPRDWCSLWWPCSKGRADITMLMWKLCTKDWDTVSQIQVA